MQIKVLGCAGGIGKDADKVLRTTSFLIDDDILIDAGTGVGELSIDALCKINHIFITHSHLDHIVSIPLLLDTVLGMREGFVTVYALEATIQTLKEHIFNWKVWPDFNVIPDDLQPLLRYEVINPGKTISLNGRHITALPANHVVPAVGYHVRSKDKHFVFSGDSTESHDFWQAINQLTSLNYLVIETAFSNEEIALAKLSKHYCPSILLAALSQLKHHPEIYITHLKPGSEALIMQQINKTDVIAQALTTNQIFTL